MKKYVGDLYAVTRKHSPPVKLDAPYNYVPSNVHARSFELCNVEPHTTDYFGFYGGHHCSVYDIVATVFTGECHAMEHHKHSSVLSQELELDHSYRSSCKANGWTDFSLVVTEDMVETNLLFEATLNREYRSNPNSVTLMLFEKEIPKDRKSHWEVEKASPNGVISLALSSARTADVFVPGDTVYMSIRCGPEPVQFKVLAVAVDPILHLEKPHHAEVCKDEWLYFHFDMPDDHHTIVGGFLRFEIEKFEGSASFIARQSERPLDYPFTDMKNDIEVTYVDVCAAESGERVYLGVKGGLLCAVFMITTHLKDDAHVLSEHVAACDEEATASHAVEQHHHQLTLGQFYYDSCLKGSFPLSDYVFTITGTDRHNNLVIELEQLLPNRVDPSALHLFGFKAKFVPISDRENNADFVRKVAVNNIHSITMNYIDLKYSDDEEYSFAVKCGIADTKFLAYLIHAEIHPGHRQFGEVCPNNWIYHYYVFYAGGHSEDVDVNALFDDGRHRKLGNSSTLSGAEEIHADEGTYLRFHVRVLHGEFFHIAVRKAYPPSFNSENSKDLSPIGYADGHVLTFDIDVCSPIIGAKYYVGIFGANSGCGKYDVQPYVMTTGKCDDTVIRASGGGEGGEDTDGDGHR